MKTKQLAAFSAVALATCFLSSPCQGQDATDPLIPDGALTAYPTVVQTGTKPTLTWSILYPSNLSGGGIVTISPHGTITLDKPHYVSVQPIGTGVTTCDPNQGSTQYNTDARMSINGGSYKQLFYGLQGDIDPSAHLYIAKHPAGTTLNFGGRYVKDGAWSPFYTTNSSSFQIAALVNGDTPPTSAPLHQSPKLANYLKPYLDSAGKVKIGPMSVLILMELGSRSHTEPCFDYQDQVLLVTVSAKRPKNNNGHGNNLDGVDVSNPGRGKGGPNGEIDPSGDYDDEK